jgi:hypothetical protein
MAKPDQNCVVSHEIQASMKGEYDEIMVLEDRRSRGASGHQPMAVGVDDCLDAVAESESGEDA